MTGSLALHWSATPPPGSWPKMMTSPSQVHAAEWPIVTPGSSKWNRSSGSSSVPPDGPPRLKTRTPVPPAHAARITSPRMTPMSWQVCIEGSVRSRLAPAGSSSGTSTMSMKSHPPPADELLYTRSRSFAVSGTAVGVWEPQTRSTLPTSSGLDRSLMSNTWRPSKPGATGSPSQVLPAIPVFVFHDLTSTSSQTTMSPWSPLQNVRETWVGLSGSEMSRMLNPSQLPWNARFPQKAISVWMSGLATAGFSRLAGSTMWPLGCMFFVRGSVDGAGTKERARRAGPACVEAGPARSSLTRGLGQPDRVAEVRVSLEEREHGDLTRAWAGVAQDVETVADVDDVDQSVADDGEAPHHDLVRAHTEGRVLVGHSGRRRRREPAALLHVRRVLDVDGLEPTGVPRDQGQVPGQRGVVRGVRGAFLVRLGGGRARVLGQQVLADDPRHPRLGHLQGARPAPRAPEGRIRERAVDLVGDE